MTTPLFKSGNSKKIVTDPSQLDVQSVVQSVVQPVVKLVALSTNGTVFAPPESIIGNKAGAATVLDASGNTLTGFPIMGLEQRVALTAISNLSTTTAIWGGY